jgi:hypothetical protein
MPAWPEIAWLFTPAQLLGWLAFGFGMACFAQTDDLRFKVLMALECAAYVLHFLLLGQPSAAASTAVSLARALASIKARTPAVGLFFIGLALAGGVWLATSWVAWLPVAASCIGTTALFFLQGLRMRVLMLLGTLLWLVHNLLVGSVGGSVLEACLAAANLLTIWRLARAQSQRAAG